MFCFFKNKNNTYYGKKTFTFYIPSPPERKSGYQEKEFDAVIEHIISLGFEIIDFKLQSHSSDKGSGLWAICIIGAKNKKVFEQKIHFDYSKFQEHNPHSEHHIPLDPDIVHES